MILLARADVSRPPDDQPGQRQAGEDDPELQLEPAVTEPRRCRYVIDPVPHLVVPVLPQFLAPLNQLGQTRQVLGAR